MTDSANVEAGTKGDHLTHTGEVRTSMNCHHCSKDFIALLDYSVNGNHVIECAHCGHEHLRKIQDGKITDDRWGSREQRTEEVIRCRRTWKHDSLPAQTTSTSEFIRSRWLDRYTQGR